MAHLKKILITPFFGDLPEWFPAFKLHFGEFLAREGYSWLFTQDLQDFNDRCDARLGFYSSVRWNSGKLWDYRPTLGLLYDDLIRGFDFWGHTDLDCVFGRVSNWVSDEFLAELDLHSNHPVYVCGCWSLYRNIARVNNLFREAAPTEWIAELENPEPSGWVETRFSRMLEASGLRYKYTFYQGDPYTSEPKLEYKDGRLYQYPQFKYAPDIKTKEEIMMYHFRRSKRWPL